MVGDLPKRKQTPSLRIPVFDEEMIRPVDFPWLETFLQCFDTVGLVLW